MATITLEEIKRKYLAKFFIENETENKLPLNFNNVNTGVETSVDSKIAHVKFVNFLLQKGLSDLQISFFRTLIEDMSIALKIKKAIKNDENDTDKIHYVQEFEEIIKEIETFTSMLSSMNINSIKFEGTNEYGFSLFMNDWYKACQDYYQHLGNVSFPSLPEYKDLTMNFITTYLGCVCSFHIYLYNQALHLQKNEEMRELANNDDLFFMETHNFFMNVLNIVASLNFNYLNIEDEANIYNVDYITKLLRLLSKIFEGCLSASEIKEFYDLVDSGYLVALPIGSYYRKWLYSKANELQESISR